MLNRNSHLEFLYFLTTPNSEILAGIMEVHEHVFEGAKLMEEELVEKENVLIFVAVDGIRVVGFKIGYKFSEDTFYSWLGGVHSDYRGKGIASELMRRQHMLIKSLGYTKVRTISRNKRREMLLLNIKHGFDVLEAFTSEKGTHKIVMEKEL
ncbi:N-acetyltransferase [Psychrobacillus glaciei]|uniref:N-acetyltransferase n=1 Tax=Psychrobacillus glaciei TaxID=2283160 RepID=A0A5J6SSZ1_9BACI|nr:GNAT family N-acetyltransferase [Psychrobacillus glaciei]QFG00634.1 N-acetyltransferase [Psychrobacillus glaciei]